MSNSKTEFRFLDDDSMVIQKTLNQWAHQYDLKLHNPKYYAEIEHPVGKRYPRMTVMVERTPKT